MVTNIVHTFVEQKRDKPPLYKINKMNILQELIEKKICFTVIKHYTKFMNISSSDFFATILKDDISILFPNYDLSLDRKSYVIKLIDSIEKKKKHKTESEKIDLINLKYELELNEYFNEKFTLNYKYNFYEYDMNSADLAEFKSNLEIFKLVKENKEGRVYELKSSSFKELV